MIIWCFSISNQYKNIFNKQNFVTHFGNLEATCHYSKKDRFYCIEVSPEDMFYCIEVSLEDRYYCIEVSLEDRFYCIEVSSEDRSYCIGVPLRQVLLYRGVP